MRFVFHESDGMDTIVTLKAPSKSSSSKSELEFKWKKCEVAISISSNATHNYRISQIPQNFLQHKSNQWSSVTSQTPFHTILSSLVRAWIRRARRAGALQIRYSPCLLIITVSLVLRLLSNHRRRCRCFFLSPVSPLLLLDVVRGVYLSFYLFMRSSYVLHVPLPSSFILPLLLPWSLSLLFPLSLPLPLSLLS